MAAGCRFMMLYVGLTTKLLLHQDRHGWEFTCFCRASRVLGGFDQSFTCFVFWLK